MTKEQRKEIEEFENIFDNVPFEICATVYEKEIKQYFKKIAERKSEEC